MDTLLNGVRFLIIFIISYQDMYKSINPKKVVCKSGLLLASLGIALGGTIIKAKLSFAQFEDTNTHWAAQYINGLAEFQAIAGFPDGSFRPQDNLTRAQFSAIVTQAFGLNTNVSPVFFNDKIPEWAAPAINAAANAELISGFPDQTFRPEELLTKAQAITILRKATDSNLTELTEDEVSSILTIYADSNTIPNFARNSIAAATRDGQIVISPFDEPPQIKSTDITTRGEVAALTYQAMTVMGKVSPLSPPNGSGIPLAQASSPPTEEDPPDNGTEGAEEDPQIEVDLFSPSTRFLSLMAIASMAYGITIVIIWRIGKAEDRISEKGAIIGIEGVTIFLIITIVSLLSLEKRIEEEGTVAIISGISGYVLGRQKAQERSSPEQTQDRE